MSRFLNSPSLSLALACTALTLSLALGADWLAAEWFDVGSPTTRGCLLAVNTVCILATLFLFLNRQRALADASQIELERLCDAELTKLQLAGYEPSIGGEWGTTVTYVARRLAKLTKRIHKLEEELAAKSAGAKRYEAQTQRVRSILSALAEPVLVIDKRDGLVLTNASADEMFSIDPTQLSSANHEQRAVRSLVHCEKLVDLLTETRSQKAFTQRSCELEWPDREGNARWFRVTARNIPTLPGQSDPDGTSQGVVALLHDISSQRMIQKRNAEFVSAVSHEMKTPLAGIKAYVELLVDGEAEDAQTQESFLGVINSETDRLQCLVDDLVDLSRIEADLAGANKCELSLNELLGEALETLQPEAAANGQRLVDERTTDDLRVLGDRQMLRLSAIHLLSNALKYTPPGGQIVLSSRLVGQQACFEIADTGVGLSPNDCVRVFEKFYRVRGAREMCDGTGLGLPIVKHILEDVHAGRIEIESELAHGSVFRVYLPKLMHGSQPI